MLSTRWRALRDVTVALKAHSLPRSDFPTRQGRPIQYPSTFKEPGTLRIDRRESSYLKYRGLSPVVIMDTLSEEIWDIVIAGTSLPQSLLAL